MEYNSWKNVENHHLEKKFVFPDFMTALSFVNVVGRIAEELNHHPNIELAWGYVTLKIWTHDQSKITEKDYEFTRQVDKEISHYSV